MEDDVTVTPSLGDLPQSLSMQSRPYVVLTAFAHPGLVGMRHAFGGWPAGLSFLLLSAATGGCAIVGVMHARRRRYDRHRLWMLRCCVLICSAVVLRLISGAAGLIGVPSPEEAYIVAAWSSWLIPLAACEIVQRLPAHDPIDLTERK